MKTLSVLAACLLMASAQAAGVAGPTLSFDGQEYQHRWSQQGQHEFTPPDDADLDAWRDMLTLNVHPAVTDADGLAALANQVLGNYQSHGRILRTASKPRTDESPAEHLAVAVFGNEQALEVAFARFMLKDGVGLVVVYGHRVYGKPAGEAMSQWLQANGPRLEQALVSWEGLPALEALQRLSRE